MSANSTKWILGLDLREGAEGPLVFARWLREQLASGPGASLDAIHVLEQDQLGFLVTGDKREQAIGLAEDALARTLERAGGGELDGSRFVEIGTPEDVLATASEGADGLILGRLAPRGKDRLTRLGGVARRLLRRLPAPTFVVPPDLGADDIGAGPIVFACDNHPSSVGGARYAVRMAELLGRELLLAHIVPMPYGWSVGYLSVESVKQVRADLLAGGERTLERWAKEHGISGRRGVVREGVVLDELAGLARDEDALMLVTGSRKLNAIERLFATSVGSELCASATCPVVVVPSDYDHS